MHPDMTLFNIWGQPFSHWALLHREEVTLPQFLLRKVCFFFRVPPPLPLVDFALYCISHRLCIVLYRPTLVDSLVDRRKRWHFFQLEPNHLCIAPPHQLLQSFTSQNHLCNMKIMMLFKLWINWTGRVFVSPVLWPSFFGLAVVFFLSL